MLRTKRLWFSQLEENDIVSVLCDSIIHDLELGHILCSNIKLNPIRESYQRNIVRLG